MTDLPTLEAALKLADQDSPLPSLAGPALKVLRHEVRDLAAKLKAGLYLMREKDAAAQVERARISGLRDQLITIAYECDRVSVQDTEHRIGRVVDELPYVAKEPPASSTLRTDVDRCRGREIFEDVSHAALIRIMRALGVVGASTSEIAALVEKRLGEKAEEAERQRRAAEVGDSATLTALIAELRQREAAGRAKYGTDVDRTDLTNAKWRQHLREELMDALLYSLAEERTNGASHDQ